MTCYEDAISVFVSANIQFFPSSLNNTTFS